MPSKLAILVAIAATTALLTSTANVLAKNQVEYALEISDNGSATWTITQTMTINDTYDNLIQFQERVRLLLEAASNETEREMFAEAISIDSTISGSYISIEYVFRWENFAEIQNGTIMIGDVFDITNFFLRLYDDGAFEMTYPSGYDIGQLVPSPSRRDDPSRLLEWFGTAEFDAGTVDISFKLEEGSSGFVETLGQNILLIGVVATILAGSLAGIFVLKRKTSERISVRPLPSTPSGPESDEEKVVKMLKSVGGSAYQSAITDFFNFSRSKTSQLLSILEKNGIIRRERKGRDKIVTLNEKEKERKR